MRILLADDHAMVRQGLIPFLRSLDADVEVVEAGTFDEAQGKSGDGAFDLILLDLHMPGMRGTEGLATLVAALPDVPVVMLSGSIEADDVMGAVQAGAAGYVPKTLSSTAMLNALRLVLSGEQYFPSFALTNTRKPDPAPAPPTVGFAADNPLANLEERERLILGMVVDGCTNKEIARALDLQEVTIKVQTRNIYRKLGAANRSQAVRIAMENGWKGGAG